MTTQSPILVRVDDAIMHITLNRPDKLNSFNASMCEALITALQDARSSASVRAILLTGSGRAFCAGQDLGDRDPRTMDSPPDLGSTIETFYNPIVRSLRSLEKPVVCAVNGVAAGAGANIALACDIVLAARSARFIQSFVKVGLVPDSGGTWNLTRLLGEARAKAIAMTATPITADVAEQWGLIWRSVDDESLQSESQTLARELAHGPSLGIASIKHAIQVASTQSMDQQLELERDLQRTCGQSVDYREGVTAFLEKRAPKFHD